MIVILDGPEKAGKSTLASKIVELSRGPARIRKWGPINGEDRLYLYALQDDCSDLNELVVWDRSYASEAVYCKLLNRPGRLKDDPFYGEWAYGRPSQSVGVRLMVLGPDVPTLRRLRDGTDHDVCPASERRMFFRYAQTYRWRWVVNAHREQYVVELAQRVLSEVDEVRAKALRYGSTPPRYAGPQGPKLLVLGEPRASGPRPREVDSWAPFGSRLTSKLGYDLDVNALTYGWSNVTWCHNQLILDTPLVVACGTNVQRWLLDNVLDAGAYERKVIPTYHPAWLYRYGDGLDKSEDVISTLKERIASLWPKTQRQST